VIESHYDSVINAPAAYEPENAPQTVNRIVTFEHGGATFDGEAVVCQRLESKTESIPLGKLLRQVFGERTLDQQERQLQARYPGPANFGLKMAASTRVRATQFRCPSDDDSEWTGRAIFPVGNGRWALAWRNDYLLILRPVSLNSPIRASFDCAKAASATEHTICLDRNLAGWDRSISGAYRSHIESGVDDPKIVRAEQRAWLAERDACGADKDCLLGKMRLRAWNLSKW